MEIERGILETGDFAFSAIPEGAVVERKSASDRPWDSEFPKVPGLGDCLAYAARRAESVDKAEAILLRAQAILQQAIEEDNVEVNGGGTSNT